MTRPHVKILVCLLTLAVLATSVGCVNAWGTTGDASDYYYQRGSIHYESFPRTYSRGAGTYGRYGRYGGY